ncbi:MAG TPA: trypsin-like peptidase domain-containing protein [Streptosporangiaceae bacterium]|nr:trypsin-like peptidase domain-containing protein [Streptosporangiaceae bacterium]
MDQQDSGSQQPQPRYTYPEHGPSGYAPPYPGQPGWTIYPPAAQVPPGGGQVPPGFGLPPVPPPPRRRPAGVVSYVAVAAIAAGVGAGVAFALTPASSSPPSATTGHTPGSGIPASPGAGRGNGAGNGNGNGAQPGTSTGNGLSGATVHRVQDAVLPGVVVINSKLQDNPDATGAEGTGMIISSTGLVLTNNHVINATNGLTATVVSTGRTYRARYLGYDQGSDVAVIQLEQAHGLTPVPLGDSSTVSAGDDVVAMGNAGGTGHITTATGAITGVNRAITASDNGSGESAEHLTGMLQTNADLIPGDSGGPLASTSGQVIAMDTATLDDTTTSQQNVGYAIPINKAMSIARQIIAGQAGSGVKVGSAGFVGVLVPPGANGGRSRQTSPRVQLQQLEQLDEQQGGSLNPAPAGCVAYAAQAGVPRRIAPASSGALLLGALCQSPAAAAGLGAGDVITAAGGRPVSSPAALTSILGAVPSGKRITLTWVTPADRTITRSITLAQAPPQ